MATVILCYWEFLPEHMESSEKHHKKRIEKGKKQGGSDSNLTFSEGIKARPMTRSEKFKPQSNGMLGYNGGKKETEVIFFIDASKTLKKVVNLGNFYI